MRLYRKPGTTHEYTLELQVFECVWIDVENVTLKIMRNDDPYLAVDAYPQAMTHINDEPTGELYLSLEEVEKERREWAKIEKDLDFLLYPQYFVERERKAE